MKKLMAFAASLVLAIPFAGAADTEQIHIVNPGQQELNSMNLRIDREATDKLRQLEQDLDALQKEFDKVSANRGVTIEGASPVSLERFQLEQDSICMDIRSRMVDIQLQIDEIKK